MPTNNPTTQTLPTTNIPTHSHVNTTGTTASPGYYVTTTNGWVTSMADLQIRGQTSNPMSVQTPSPLLGRSGKQAFMLHPDWRIEADWRELMTMKDEYLAGNAPQHAWAAALWLARNTR